MKKFICICSFLFLNFYYADSFSDNKINRWYVYSDLSDANSNHGEWSNVMPTECGENGNTTIDLNNTSHPALGSSSVKLQFKISDPPGWCGLMVTSKAGFWGKKTDKDVSSLDKIPFYDLHEYNKLVYSARGEDGGENIQVKFAITGGYELGDSAPLPFDCGNVKLTKKWKKFECPIEIDMADRHQFLGRVISPFVVIVSKSYNPNHKNVIFYLDEIYFEK